MFQIRKEIATTEIRKKEIQLIQEDTIQTNKIIIDPEIDTTATIPQKTTITNIIHHTKDNT